jgi:hypothetical protein
VEDCLHDDDEAFITGKRLLG